MTSDHIRWALRKRYCQPQYSISFEIGDSTGVNVRRHLDAVTMQMYPSRGYTLWGWEIKIDRQDLKREIANPDKADAIGKYMDAFYIVVPKDLKVLELDIPVSWGLVECDENYELKTIKKADQIEAATITRPFLAALFRSMCNEDEFRANLMIKEKVDALTKFLENDFNSRVQRARDLQRSENDVKIKWADTVINELQTAGFDWRNLRWHEHDFVLAVKAALTYESIAIDGVEIACQMMENTARELRKQVTEIRGKSSKRDEIEFDNSVQN